MPRLKQARHTDVKDIRSILRLTFEQGLSIRAVSDRLKISKTSVSTYLLRARESGLAVWPLPPGLDEDDVLEHRLFRRMGRPPRDTCQCRVNFPQLCRSKIPHLCRRGRQGVLRIFRRPAAWLLRWCECRGRYKGFGSNVLRHEFGMLPQPVTRSLDLHDDGVMKQAVEQRGCDDRIAKTSPHSAKPWFDVRIIAPLHIGRSRVGRTDCRHPGRPADIRSHRR